MHAYHGSASAEAGGRDTETVLIIGLNWLGDSIMAMPALQAYRRANPGKRMVMLVKTGLAELWPMHPAIDETWHCPEIVPEMPGLIRRIRATRFQTAYILPQSFRSALIPFLAGVPERIGTAGHWRRFMLTRTAPRLQNAGMLHQQHEYAAILGQAPLAGEMPAIRPDKMQIEKAKAVFGQVNTRYIGLIPGAARGPAKRWPARYFSELGRILKNHGKIALFGGKSDQELCAQIAGDIGGDPLVLAGQTSLPEFAALLSLCSLVIGNDSGGVHLAAAAGAPVLVIYGMTDPARTKPLGKRVAVLQDSPRRARDIPRRSAEAEMILQRISPQLAAETALKILSN